MPKGTQKVVADLPQELFEETEKLAAELHLSRSATIRWAIEKAVKEHRRAKLAKEIDEYFDVFGERDRKITKEFEASDWETF
jgi:metal-responsive CopG/Arc/MetJ family transcriptional regulator